MTLSKRVPGWLSGWNKRKKLTIASTVEVRKDIFNFYIYNTTGTDVGNFDVLGSVYIGANVRSDWGDLCITKADGTTKIPFCILRQETTFVYVAMKCDVKNGNTDFYLYYDGPSPDLFKIGSTSDQHYGTPDTYADRHLALTFLANFNTRMAVYAPDLIACNGDHTHYTPTTEATQLGFMESVFDAVHAGPVGIEKVIVAPGNHDFEYMSFANVRALVDDYQTWMESGELYGKAYESTDYIFFSLDSNYDPATQAHMSLTHQGF